MKILRNAVLLFAGCVSLLACAPPAPKAPDTAADEAALRADPVAWFDAYAAGNVDAIANSYAEDALLMPPGAPAVQGRAAIREFWVADIAATKQAGGSLKFDEVTGVGVSGDTGWLSATFSVSDASGAVSKGKFLSVYRREKGDWQLLRDTWNMDAGAPAAAAPQPADAAKPPM